MKNILFAKSDTSAGARHTGAAFKHILPIVAVLIFMILILVRPDFYITSARRGLSIYATAVLPALFPFFFCTVLLTKIGGVEVMSGIGKRPVKFLFNAPPESAYIFMMAVMSGYPTGASMTSDLYKNGVISSRQAKSIFAFASTSGPIFILGTLGSAIFDNYKVGLIILFSHYIAAVINGIIFRMKGKPGDSEIILKTNPSTDNILQETVTKSTTAMLAVGCYVVVTGMLVDTLSLIHIDALIYSALPADAAQSIISLLYGLLEMTRGGMECAKITNLQLATALASAAVSFGGLSVILQSATFMTDCKLKTSGIILRKFTHAAVAFVLAYLFGFGLF